MISRKNLESLEYNMADNKQIVLGRLVVSYGAGVPGGHIPVLLNEVITLLNPQPGEFFIDGTAGAGGHSRAMKEKIGADGRLLAIDWDKTGENYADLAEILAVKKIGQADGLLLDLGFSSEQLGNGRGFSFQKDEPLLMTYDSKQKPVRELLNELSEQWLADIIKNYGEERYAKPIAAAIKNRARKAPIETTGELADVIRLAVPKSYERGRLHPATRTFQALRIYANHELENLEQVLKDLPKILKPGGRIGIISFHSLEDRIVKNFFRDAAKAGTLKLITKKAVQATRGEALANPRSRSAKLRVAQLI